MLLCSLLGGCCDFPARDGSGAALRIVVLRSAPRTACEAGWHLAKYELSLFTFGCARARSSLLSLFVVLCVCFAL